MYSKTQRRIQRLVLGLAAASMAGLCLACCFAQWIEPTEVKFSAASDLSLRALVWILVAEHFFGKGDS